MRYIISVIMLFWGVCKEEWKDMLTYFYTHTGSDFFFRLYIYPKLWIFLTLTLIQGFFFYIWHRLPRKWNLSTQGKFILKAGISKIYFNTLKIEITTEIRFFSRGKYNQDPTKGITIQETNFIILTLLWVSKSKPLVLV